jgi:hypothetical protein
MVALPEPQVLSGQVVPPLPPFTVLIHLTNPEISKTLKKKNIQGFDSSNKP